MRKEKINRLPHVTQRESMKVTGELPLTAFFPRAEKTRKRRRRNAETPKCSDQQGPEKGIKRQAVENRPGQGSSSSSKEPATSLVLQRSARRPRKKSSFAPSQSTPTASFVHDTIEISDDEVETYAATSHNPEVSGAVQGVPHNLDIADATRKDTRAVKQISKTALSASRFNGTASTLTSGSDIILSGNPQHQIVPTAETPIVLRDESSDLKHRGLSSRRLDPCTTLDDPLDRDSLSPANVSKQTRHRRLGISTISAPSDTVIPTSQPTDYRFPYDTSRLRVLEPCRSPTTFKVPKLLTGSPTELPIPPGDDSVVLSSQSQSIFASSKSPHKPENARISTSPTSEMASPLRSRASTPGEIVQSSQSQSEGDGVFRGLSPRKPLAQDRTQSRFSSNSTSEWVLLPLLSDIYI